MVAQAPVTDLDPAFSSPNATPTPWSDGQRRLEQAHTYWLATVRPEGRPHATTIAAVWVDGRLHFTTGDQERKAKNLALTHHCLVIAGCDGFEGLDVVLEGEAVPVTDPDRLERIAESFIAKYGELFAFEVERDHLRAEDTTAHVLAFEIRPTKGFGFGKGDAFSQTRWRF